MNDIQIQTLYSEVNIFNALTSCSDSLYNQDVNNPDCIKELAHKYYEHGVCYVVCVNKEIAGFVSCYVNDNVNHIGFLSIIVVRRAFQGLGLGSLLLDVVITTCKINDIKELRLSVASSNNPAMSFYSNRGFKLLRTVDSDSLILYKNITSVH